MNALIAPPSSACLETGARGGQAVCPCRGQALKTAVVDVGGI